MSAVAPKAEVERLRGRLVPYDANLTSAPTNIGSMLRVVFSPTFFLF
jgi:hypothetical protein